MSRFTKLSYVAASLALAACADTTKVTSPSAQPDGSSSFNNGVNGQQVAAAARVCPGAVVGTARCHAWVVTDAAGNPLATTGPSGYGPNDLQSAYALASAAATNGGTATVAIVDAYDDPNAENDMNVYRAQFGLPSCTTANGCFRKVNQSGGSTPPRANGGWAQEISLDLDMVSAVCPKCHILLVEASSNAFANLSAAVDYAASVPGVVAISNSYGGSEYSSELNDQAHYNHPGVAVTVSSGDNGYGVEFPAASQYVVAVGGTSLKRAAGTARGFTESVWSGAGSGCSAYVAKQSWQTDAGCARRTVADVAAVADPNTGVAVYDSYAYRGASGWMVFGGTSAAAPIIAAVHALHGGSFSISSVYSSSASLFDVTSGSNGSCGGSYLCTGVAGFDGPTGRGTPNGITSF